MDEIALKALKASIVKWEKNLARAIAEDNGSIGIGSDSCPLCHEYHCYDCDGCPVFEQGGGYVCRGTPYDDVVRALQHEDFPRVDQPALVAACQAEVDFLKSLLPEES